MQKCNITFVSEINKFLVIRPDVGVILHNCFELSNSHFIIGSKGIHWAIPFDIDGGNAIIVIWTNAVNHLSHCLLIVLR